MSVWFNYLKEMNVSLGIAARVTDKLVKKGIL